MHECQTRRRDAGEHIERRLRFVFTRFSPGTNLIMLDVKNARRPISEFDSGCKIVVKLIPKEEVEVEVHDLAIRSAVARAVDSAGRAVERIITLQRSS